LYIFTLALLRDSWLVGTVLLTAGAWSGSNLGHSLIAKPELHERKWAESYFKRSAREVGIERCNLAILSPFHEIAIYVDSSTLNSVQDVNYSKDFVVYTV
jgi:hypothetical protein